MNEEDNMKNSSFRYSMTIVIFLLFGSNCNNSHSDINESLNQSTSWDAEEIYLTTRPQLGPTWIVDLHGTSSAERLFMRSLQGIVNRNTARLYLVNSDNQFFGEGEQFWIDEYERRGWVDLKGQLSIEEALDQFAPDIDGFVVASEEEPWSIHVAAVLAMLKNAVVAPDVVADRLRQSGWMELDDTRGRWSDALTAFQNTVDTYKDQLAYPGIALLRPTENLWDFVIQQEIMPLFTRPKHETWEGVAAIIDDYPPRHILYGYVSDDTVEEEIAVERASSSGKYLVPTHEVSNLSFHVAVMAQSPIKPLHKTVPETVEPCDSSKVNVAIAITDGDNLQVPILQYPQSLYWNTPERGTLPLGWSMGMGLSTLAPGIWEYYRSTIREQDEIVALMGIAYVHAASLPDPTQYFENTFAAMSHNGVHVLWSLDSSLTITDNPLWQTLKSAAGSDILDGVLVGYGPSIDKAFRRNSGTPVLITQNGYSDDASDIKTRIEEIMALEPDQRSPVNFLMATNWDTRPKDFYETLKPLAEQGVRFLTPAQALACMPNIEGKARSAVENEAPPGQCIPAGYLEQFGSTILSAPTLAEVNKPITLKLTPTVEATLNSGHRITYSTLIDIDVSGFARHFLENRVLPVIEGYGLSNEFAEEAWVKFMASNVLISIPIPENTTKERMISQESSGINASIDFNDNNINMTLDTFTADSREGNPRVHLTVVWSVQLDDSAPTTPIILGPESATMDFALTVGIGAEDGTLVGGVQGAMKCKGTEDLAKTSL
jgi:hypothetical protein